MEYNYSLMEFFLFSVFVFIISGCGLLRRFTPSNDEERWVVICEGLPPFVRGGVAKQQGGWEKIENWKLKIENGKLKIEN